MKTLYQLLLDRWSQKTDTVLVTIVEGNGSIPRTTGAYMAVDKTGRIYGTIGGGNLEYQAVKKAMELTGTDAHFVEDFDLGTGENGGLGMVCGGNVKVLFYSVRVKDPAVGAFFKEALAAADEGKPYWLVLPFLKERPGSEERSQKEEDIAGFWRKTDRRFTQKNSVTMEGFTFLEAVLWLRSWFRCSVIWDSGVGSGCREEYTDHALFPGVRRQRP